MKRKAANTKASPESQSILNDVRWDAVVRRDRQADGTFVYSVRSTGVFCRPGCSSRTPRPENVRFHANAQEAIRAGFRPCQRCKPDQSANPSTEAIATLCRTIERAVAAGDPLPPLEALAQQVGLSQFHLHRQFRAATGLTPRQYANACRSKQMLKHLKGSPTVTESIYETGFSSSSRFYHAAANTLGMTPTQFRKGGQNTDITYAIGPSTLGMILVARSPRGICAILMGDTEETLLADLQQRFPRASLVPGDTAFSETLEKVVAWTEQPRHSHIDLPLDIRGTAFQQRVWQALQAIPAGETASYAEIAQRIGNPRSVRAVAQACASNALAVAIPCHRVLRSDGALSGYRWGVERKKELLRREQVSH
ncbi:bifunctional DNA-binding transcriptional regulator/O6-methylguanine-DNA methyltransferase Ada [Terriglobus sp. RCC_193]|uniref:bifunctional DNA-binding transcriptional regulator/O6-methylguanine-DNA methyltransferase Ada n=1 Tax=Terriglobus sp. RCC_193 TaxID=3239218 RepID=UPI0035247339